MSIRTLLMPVISQHLLARERLLKLRARAERERLAGARTHQVHYFHQVDDPYSALVAGILPQLIARYDIDVVPHVVGPPPDSAAPEREKLIAYSRKDARLLARHWNLVFDDLMGQPQDQSVEAATRLLVAAVQDGTFIEAAGEISTCLWSDPPSLFSMGRSGGPLRAVDPSAVSSHVAASNALRQQLGHYLGATFFYAGEWYWGIDRLHHLERRLQDLGAQRLGVQDLMFPPDADLSGPVSLASPLPIDFFFSFRSPYSAIVAPRVFELGRRTGAPVRLRFVLPMVMRGLPVPREKRTYISLDAAREAHARGTPFGRLNDPVGRPTERGLSLIPIAEQMGCAEAYVLSFMHGVRAEGIDAGSDRGLRRIVERAGLSWDAAQRALKEDAWRATAEANRKEMFDLGLWGVPSFRVGDTAVWGQDRLWAVQDALLKQDPGCGATLSLQTPIRNPFKEKR
ncbi:MAG: DsbA family protein [Comamonadaceae bacterium]|nr:DsbA family protein [Comamonadaceae bacterium]